MKKNTIYDEEKIRIEFNFIKAKLPVNSPNISMLKAIFLDSLFTHNESGEYLFLKELFSFEKSNYFRLPASITA